MCKWRRSDASLVGCDQPGNLPHEARYGYRASWPPEPPLELLACERSLNWSPEVNTKPTHSASPVRKERVTQGCSDIDATRVYLSASILEDSI